MSQRTINVCPSLLVEGHSTYCPQALHNLFDDKTKRLYRRIITERTVWFVRENKE